MSSNKILIISLFFLFTSFSLSSVAQEKDLNNSASNTDDAFELGINIMADLHQPLVFGRSLKDGGLNDSIAIKLHNCTQAHIDTIGINDCLSEAYESYDKVLNQVYQLALKANDSETREALKLSEKKWIAFQKAESNARGSYGNTPRGTILGVAIGYQRITAIRERIAELMFYLGADQG